MLQKLQFNIHINKSRFSSVKFYSNPLPPTSVVVVGLILYGRSKSIRSSQESFWTPGTCNDFSLFSANFIQGKWKNMKDTFIKSLKSSSGTKYKYYDDLSFMLKNDELNSSAVAQRNEHMSARIATRRSAQASPSGTVLLRGRKRKIKEKPAKHPRSSERLRSDPEQDIEIDVVSTPVSSPKRETQASFSSNLDEDEAFFMSIMPSVRKMSEDDKLLFRMEVLRIIRDIRIRSEMNQAEHSCSGMIFMKNDHQIDEE